MADDAHGTTAIIETGSIWKDTIQRFLSRMFLLTVAVLIVASAAFWAGRMGDQTYLAFCTLILGSYHAANIIDKKQNGS